MQNVTKLPRGRKFPVGVWLKGEFTTQTLMKSSRERGPGSKRPPSVEPGEQRPTPDKWLDRRSMQGLSLPYLDLLPAEEISAEQAPEDDGSLKNSPDQSGFQQPRSEERNVWAPTIRGDQIRGAQSSRLRSSRPELKTPRSSQTARSFQSLWRSPPSSGSTHKHSGARKVFTCLLSTPCGHHGLRRRPPGPPQGL